MQTTPERIASESRPMELFDSGVLAMMHMANDWNHEAARFFHHRVNAYAELASALGRCTTPPAAMMCWSRFVTDTVEDYAREMMTVQGFARRAAEEAVLTAEAAAMPVKSPILD